MEGSSAPVFGSRRLRREPNAAGNAQLGIHAAAGGVNGLLRGGALFSRPLQQKC